MKAILKYIKSWGIHWRWTIGLFWFILICADFSMWFLEFSYKEISYSLLTVIIIDLVIGFDRTSPIFSFLAYNPDAWENECAWFAHSHTQKEVREYFENTGEYIDGKPIQSHYRQTNYICTKCGDKNYGDSIKIY